MFLTTLTNFGFSYLLSTCNIIEILFRPTNSVRDHDQNEIDSHSATGELQDAEEL